MKETLLNLEQLFRSQCRAHSERRKKNPLQRSLTSVPPNSQLVLAQSDGGDGIGYHNRHRKPQKDSQYSDLVSPA
jgi:hypothetical protein